MLDPVSSKYLTLYSLLTYFHIPRTRRKRASSFLAQLKNQTLLISSSPPPRQRLKTPPHFPVPEFETTPVIIIIALAAVRGRKERQNQVFVIACAETKNKRRRRWRRSTRRPFLCNCGTHTRLIRLAAASAAVISLKRGHLCETDLKFRSWRCVLNIVTECDFAYTYLIYQDAVVTAPDFQRCFGRVCTSSCDRRIFRATVFPDRGSGLCLSDFLWKFHEKWRLLE